MSLNCMGFGLPLRMRYWPRTASIEKARAGGRKGARKRRPGPVSAKLATVLALRVGSQVGVPVELDVADGVSDAVLGVEDHRVVETGDEDAILMIFKEDTGGLGTEQAAEAAGVGDAAAIVGTVLVL